MTAVTRYFADVRARLDDLESTQSDAIAAAAGLGAAAIGGRRPIHIYDTGHLINHEFIARTGGLAAYTALTFGATVATGNEWVAMNRGPGDPSGERSAHLLVEWLFEQGTLQPGDVLFLSSVSGTNVMVVELARQARQRGISVIAVTGVDFSRQLPSKHSSGQRLFEAADVVLDNRVPYGDSALRVEGTEPSVAAWSGLAGAILMWAVTVGIVKKCVEAGVNPTVYSSYNLPGGGASYETSRARYRTSGQ